MNPRKVLKDYMIRTEPEIPISKENPVPVEDGIYVCNSRNSKHCLKECAHRKRHTEYGEICCAVRCQHTGKIVQCIPYEGK